jgi:hypothetical protein
VEKINKEKKDFRKNVAKFNDIYSKICKATTLLRGKNAK